MFPGIELEQITDHSVAGIGELTFFTQPDIINVQKIIIDTGRAGTVLQILYCCPVFGGITTATQVQQLYAGMLL